MGEPAEQRFEQLWTDHAQAVVRYARRHVLPDDVEDVVAETFVVAWRRLDEVPAFGLPWLLGVARGVSANARRARRRRDALTERISAQPAEDPAWPVAGPDDEVTAALHRLSDADRELLTLLAWDGLSHEEAAEALGCTRGALKVRLHRTRRRFAALLGEHTADPQGVTTVLPLSQPGGIE
ncbi:RNA polymerase sigma factor [uncultured Modestobacter sp.]|uniref:RNA polymerase sigma factor n=1 Tax=uncultured Modestobacter sp. TaxID=380048 RepID=UPI002637068B|nr:sigma-70 family RNA polymerase sigma factor [uncultured Modestobacter sp.]